MSVKRSWYCIRTKDGLILKVAYPKVKSFGELLWLVKRDMKASTTTEATRTKVRNKQEIDDLQISFTYNSDT